jgi:hypothetical protein
MAGQTARAAPLEEHTNDGAAAGRPETPAPDADLTYGCVDWYLYDDEDLKLENKARRLGPKSVYG